MAVTNAIRYGILGLAAVLCAGLLVLGIMQYQADRRAALFTGVAHAADAPGKVAPEPKGEGARQAGQPRQGQPGNPADSSGAVAPEAGAGAAELLLVVHVAGRVAHPGVYRLQPGARVGDAVAAAGGPLPDGLPDALNLAATVSDGEKIHLPGKDDLPVPMALTEPSAAGAAKTSPLPGKQAPARVRLNSATVKELEALPYISDKTARAIVAYRQQHGPFQRVDDVTKVSGVQKMWLPKLRELLQV